ncbi:hypothetical protein Hanom_Chr02g00099751 [Helianthus anomalus]
MPSSYPGRHMPLPRLESSTSEKKWVSVANWATPAGLLSAFVRPLMRDQERESGRKNWNGRLG